MTETTTEQELDQQASEQAEPEAAEAESQEAALAEQPAEGPRLKWRPIGIDGESWYAENTAGLKDQDIVAAFYIDRATEDEGGLYVDAVPPLVNEGGDPQTHLILEAAQQWCEARNAELCAAAKAPAADIVTPPIGSAPRAEPEGAMLLQLADIVEQEQKVARLEAGWEAAKEEAAGCKKAFDAGVDKLRRIIRYPNGPGPLFETNAEPAAAADVTPETGAYRRPLPAPSCGPATRHESWRAVTLEELGLTKPRIVKALTEHVPPLTTLGALGDWIKLKGDFWAADIDGIGPKAREEIEEASASWWAARAVKAMEADRRSEGFSETPPAAESFDDDAILPETSMVAIDAADPVDCRIESAQRAGGRWCYHARARIGKRIHDVHCVGHHTSEQEAIDAALAEVKAWVGKCAQQGFRGDQADEAGGILRVIDAVSKAAVAEGVGA